MSEPTPTQVGYSFVSVYYTTLIQDPHSLFKFYKDESQLTHRVNIHEEGELLATGLEDIKDRIARLVGEEEDAKVKLVFVDSQKSLDGGVFVSVEGQISFKTEEPLKKFTQSFLLVPQQPTGYFVMNDVFRFVSPSSSTAATSSEVGDLNVPSQNVAANPASVEPRRSHYASSSTSSSKLADVDEVSEPDSTDATIGASSVTGVDDSMSQMMKDVEEGGSAMNQSESAQNLNQLNEDEEEEEEEQDNSEGNESDEQAAAAQSSPTKSSQEPVVDKKETPPKTYSSWSHVVGGVEYTPSETPTTNNTQESNNSNNTNNNTSRPKREKSDRSRNENRKPRSRDEQSSSSSFKNTEYRDRNQDKYAVYVYKLQQVFTDKDIRDSFEPYGNIVDILNKSSSEGGYALVFYDSKEAVDKVLANRSKVQINGQNVLVDKHQRKGSSPHSGPSSGGANGSANSNSTGRGRGSGGRGRGRGRGVDNRSNDWSTTSPREERTENAVGRGRGERGRGRGFVGRARGAPQTSTN